MYVYLRSSFKIFADIAKALPNDWLKLQIRLPKIVRLMIYYYLILYSVYLEFIFNELNITC